MGRKGIGGHFEAKERIKEIDGSERETSMKVQTRVNFLGSGVRYEEGVIEKDENGVKRVEREQGIHISPLITENRVVDKTSGEVDGEEFERGFDVGVKNEKLKRAVRVASGKADHSDRLGVVSDIFGETDNKDELFGIIKRSADRFYERRKVQRGTVFDKTEENAKYEEMNSQKVVEPSSEVDAKSEEIPLVKENNISEKEEKGVEPKMSEKEKKELKEDIKEQKDVQENVLKRIDEAKDKEEKIEQIDRHFEPKRYEMQVIESINKFDTKVLDRENIRVKENQKNKAYNQAVIKRMQEFRWR